MSNHHTYIKREMECKEIIATAWTADFIAQLRPRKYIADAAQISEALHAKGYLNWWKESEKEGEYPRSCSKCACRLLLDAFKNPGYWGNSDRARAGKVVLKGGSPVLKTSIEFLIEHGFLEQGIGRERRMTKLHDDFRKTLCLPDDDDCGVDNDENGEDEYRPDGEKDDDDDEGGGDDNENEDDYNDNEDDDDDEDEWEDGNWCWERDYDKYPKDIKKNVIFRKNRTVRVTTTTKIKRKRSLSPSSTPNKRKRKMVRKKGTKIMTPASQEFSRQACDVNTNSSKITQTKNDKALPSISDHNNDLSLHMDDAMDKTTKTKVHRIHKRRTRVFPSDEECALQGEGAGASGETQGVGDGGSRKVSRRKFSAWGSTGGSQFNLREENSTDAMTNASPMLVLDEDLQLLTNYFFYLFKQLRPCRFTEKDRALSYGMREEVKIGYGGFQCIHCADLPVSRKFFWRNVDALANNSTKIARHILNCRRCPKQNKDALMRLKQGHSDQMSKLPRGSQKIFFRRMWRRLHDGCPQGDDEDAPARTVPSPQRAILPLDNRHPPPNHHHDPPHQFQYCHLQEQYYRPQQQYQYHHHLHQHHWTHQQHRSELSDERDGKQSSSSLKVLASTKAKIDTSKPILIQPKPPRTAFMCFKDNSEKEIMKKEGIVKDNDDLFKTFATAWRNLSEKDQAYWEEEACNDNARFVREKAVYKGSWHIPKRRAKKHPGAPKRPMTAFLKFSKGRRKTVKRENPDLCHIDISRLLGEMWRNTSEVEKAPYVEAEIEERKKYKDVKKKWKDEQPQLNAVTLTFHESAAHINRNNSGAYGNPYASRLPMATTGVHSPPVPLEIIDRRVAATMTVGMEQSVAAQYANTSRSRDTFGSFRLSHQSQPQRRPPTAVKSKPHNIKGMDSSPSHSKPPSPKTMTTMMTTTTEEAQDISVDDVNDRDILMGSRKCYRHPGNKAYRYNVLAYQPQLEAIGDRTVVANMVIDHIHNEIGGRFLKVDSTNQWHVIPRLDVITKIRKALVELKGNYISNATKDRSIDDDDIGETFRFARV